MFVKGDLRIDAPAPFCPTPYSIRAETKFVEVGPNEVTTLVTKQYEIRYKSDHSIGTYLSPTKNPLVRVTIPDQMDYEFGLGREPGAGESVEQSQHTRRHQLKGVYFPPAHMRIRWWPKAWAEERRLQELAP
jgi:hypothetical protein